MAEGPTGRYRAVSLLWGNGWSAAGTRGGISELDADMSPAGWGDPNAMQAPANYRTITGSL